MERPAGIEPASQRWQRRHLPLKYGRMIYGGWGRNLHLHRLTAVLQTVGLTRAQPIHETLLETRSRIRGAYQTMPDPQIAEMKKAASGFLWRRLP